MNRYDDIVVGSGIAGLVFAALSASKGHKVLVLEAHEYAGGYGHTFQMGKSAKFNAQLHYVWNCGEGETVHKVLSQLGLAQEVTFEQLDPDGFDHMHMPGYSLKIPSSAVELEKRMSALFPQDRLVISRFIKAVARVANGLDVLASKPSAARVLKGGLDTVLTLSFLKSSLQDAFDRYRLPKAAQTLLASQWPDFLLPPEQLSFYAWVMLFTGYQRGAYYPTHHFEHVIDSLVASIRQNNGDVLLQHEVTEFVLDKDRVIGVVASELASGGVVQFTAEKVICNMDPQLAADMIGRDKFAKSVSKRLCYDYSPSNFMIYCAIEGIDLAQHGFGKWNVFHTGHDDLNEAFNAMYLEHDYSNPSFAMTTPSFMTADASDRPPGQSIVEILTVADYHYFNELLKTDRKAYLRKKKEVVNALLDKVEEHYIPDFRQHLVFCTGGTPTTNEKFCLAPSGNSYGSNMTAQNIGPGRLKEHSSLQGLYFCNASSGFAGFAGTFWTGARLYEKLSSDSFL